MTDKQKKAILKRGAKKISDCAIAYVKSSPCCICAGEMPHYKCYYGYIHRGACPVYKDLKRRLEVVVTFESEADND